MSNLPNLNPISQTSAVVLPATGSTVEVNQYVPLGVYSTSGSDFYSPEFISGAVDQVAFTYKKLGGDVLDIELTTGNVYAAYEESVLEYSYLINVHQAKNSLSRVMGSPTGTFDEDGVLQSGSLKSSLSGSHASLKFPRFSFDYERSIMEGVASQISIGQSVTEYSASIVLTASVQDYNLQKIVSDAAASGAFGSSFSLSNKRAIVTKVYYHTPAATWRFFGQYGMGGLNVMGNLSSYGGYGMYADDSTFEVVPVWQNILQAMAHKMALKVRTSHYSYEIVGSFIRLYPQPAGSHPSTFWFRFKLVDDPWEEKLDPNLGIKENSGINGINNMNTLPFEVLPFTSINSIGKSWIRKYAYYLSLETLAQIRGKFGNHVPIPGNNISLNADALMSESQKGQEDLRKELMEILEKMEYAELAKRDAELMEATGKVAEKLPNLIFVG